jgi:hypothetical protein
MCAIQQSKPAFSVADASAIAAPQTSPGTGSALGTLFDSLPSVGDPVSAPAPVYASLKPTAFGSLLNRFTNDPLEKNLNSLGRFAIRH